MSHGPVNSLGRSRASLCSDGVHWCTRARLVVLSLHAANAPTRCPPVLCAFKRETPENRGRAQTTPASGTHSRAHARAGHSSKSSRPPSRSSSRTRRCVPLPPRLCSPAVSGSLLASSHSPLASKKAQCALARRPAAAVRECLRAKSDCSLVNPGVCAPSRARRR
jgi:hypothetical protein